MGRAGNYIGANINRSDIHEKVTGGAVYIGDMKLPRMLYGRVLRSPAAHALIKSIDLSALEGLKGVAAVVTGEDVQGRYNNFGLAIPDQPLVAVGKVRFAGEPVAAVAAEDEYTAARAVQLIRVEYQKIAHALEIDEAVSPGAPLVHDQIRVNTAFKDLADIKPIQGTNICNHFRLSRGSVEEGFREADRVFEDVFTTRPIQHAPLEVHVAIAQAVPGKSMEVWSNNQHPHIIRGQLQQVFGLPLSQIRVKSAFIGGAFGCKTYPKLEPLAAALALKAGRPVKLCIDRQEEFRTITRHGSKVYIKTGVKKDGAIVAREIRIYFDTGAYADIGPRVVRNAGAAATGPYNIPHVKIDSYGVYTNKPPAGAYRGFGVSQAAWAYESHTDNIAAGLGIDPLEFRLKNILKNGDVFATGETMTDTGFDMLLKSSAGALGWGRDEPGEGAGKGRATGKGLACCLKTTITPSTSNAGVMMFSDGSVVLHCSTIELGQGCQTVLTQIAAQELNIPPEKISRVQPDTNVTPFDQSTSSSRSTFHMGNALILACRDLKQKLIKSAAAILQEPGEVLKFREGEIYSTLTGQSVSYGDAVRGPGIDPGSLIGYGTYQTEGGLDPDTGQGKASVFWMAAAGAARVEVDLETGKVTVPRYAGASDVGRALNPANCKQQNEGSIAMAIGHAFFEEMIYDREGNLQNDSFVDYKVPTVKDLPGEMVAINVEIPHSEGPYGAKGIGEILSVPPSPAIANAIYDATGVRVRDLPVTPERLLNQIRQKKQENQQQPGGGKND